jgi:cytochrome c-type biogenesis protein CcmH
VRALTRAVAVLLALAAAGAAQEPAGDPVRAAVGPPRGARLEGATLETRTNEIAALLRCPVCQGLSVADSPSTMAVNMRGQVKELVAAGYDEEQILAYFEGSYGEFVRLQPKLRGVNWLVWLAPVLGLLLGAVVIRWALRAPRSGTPAASAAGESAEVLPGPDTLPADPALVPYVLRVRERAYGWPGGVSPASPTANLPPMTSTAPAGDGA